MYTCGECGFETASKQVLGGHVRAHRRGRQAPGRPLTQLPQVAADGAAWPSAAAQGRDAARRAAAHEPGRGPVDSAREVRCQCGNRFVNGAALQTHVAFQRQQGAGHLHGPLEGRLGRVRETATPPAGPGVDGPRPGVASRSLGAAAPAPLIVLVSLMSALATLSYAAALSGPSLSWILPGLTAAACWVVTVSLWGVWRDLRRRERKG